MVNCPVCNKEMPAEDFDGLTVHVCENGCKSIWFDWMELAKLDHKTNKAVGAALQAALAAPRTNNIDRAPLKCPKCGILMHRHQYKSEKEVNVDECFQCGGFFIDSGELKEIRDKYMSEAEQEAYTQKLELNIPSYVNAEADLQKFEMRTEAIDRYTKFMRLSYYATGK